MRKNILIVEDDPFTVEFYKYFFKRTEYSIIHSENGDEILTILNNNHIALIILDINLKNTFMMGRKIDGLYLLNYVKNEQKYSAVPVLIVTAYQRNFSSQKCFDESLADDYITKPISNFNELLDKIHNLVKD